MRLFKNSALVKCMVLYRYKAKCVSLLATTVLSVGFLLTLLPAALQAKASSLNVSLASEQQKLQQLVLDADSKRLITFLQSVPEPQLRQLFSQVLPIQFLMTNSAGCHLEVIDALIAADAAVEFGNDGNALHYIGYFSQAKDNFSCIDKLLALGLDINQQDRDGYTPLVKLLYSQNEHTPELLSYMLTKGANPLVRSQTGMDFLHHALALELLYSEQLHFLPEGDALYTAAEKMVGTAQFARNLYSEFYADQQSRKIKVSKHD